MEGQTLRERVTQGTVPLDQLVQSGIEIADALDAAHEDSPGFLPHGRVVYRATEVRRII
jgi:hypothetical protein